jgi:hypothetical protein
VRCNKKARSRLNNAGKLGDCESQLKKSTSAAACGIVRTDPQCSFGSARELATSERFKSILTSQMLQLIPPKPSEHTENLEWLVRRVVDLNFDFGPYTLPLRSVYRKGAKGIYPMPLPSRDHDSPVHML